MPLLALLTVATAIAVWQAFEVVGRIQQLLWYHKKFSGHSDEIIPITAGTTATVLFAAGTLVGIAICHIGIREASGFTSMSWKPPFWVVICSTVTFGVGWLALVMSPYVELHAR
jgi:hypothetical protein